MKKLQSKLKWVHNGWNSSVGIVENVEREGDGKVKVGLEEKMDEKEEKIDETEETEKKQLGKITWITFHFDKGDFSFTLSG